MMRWLLMVVLCALPVFANQAKRECYVQAEVVALRETLWTLSEAAERGDVGSTQQLVDLAWQRWLDIDRSLRSDIKYAYPNIERQMDRLQNEALGRARYISEIPNPPPVVLPTRIDVRYPGYSDPYDLFGNCGLGR